MPAQETGRSAPYSLHLLASRFAAKEQRSKALWQVEHRHNRMAVRESHQVTTSSIPGLQEATRAPLLLTHTGGCCPCSSASQAPLAGCSLMGVSKGELRE